MATRFEALILYDEKHYARQAVEAAFAEVDRLEQLLSRYVETSDISRINNLQTGESTLIGLETYACLSECQQLFKETNGAFDVGAGNLIDAWKNPTRSNEKLETLPEEISIHNLRLTSPPPTAETERRSITIDLGGYGKGYALDRMAELLREWEVDCALLHSGMSTALALEPPPNEAGWPITISHPLSQAIIKTLTLSNVALSGSGLQKGRHIIDPRTGRAVTHTQSAWAVADSAARADALSTAFMVMQREETESYFEVHPDKQGAVLSSNGEFFWYGPPTGQSA